MLKVWASMIKYQKIKESIKIIWSMQKLQNVKTYFFIYFFLEWRDLCAYSQQYEQHFASFKNRKQNEGQVQEAKHSALYLIFLILFYLATKNSLNLSKDIK